MQPIRSCTAHVTKLYHPTKLWQVDDEIATHVTLAVHLSVQRDNLVIKIQYPAKKMAMLCLTFNTTKLF